VENVRFDGRFLALDMELRHPLHDCAVGEALERLGADYDITRGCAALEAGSEVDGVADDAVLSVAPAGTHDAGVHLAAVDANAEPGPLRMVAGNLASIDRRPRQQKREERDGKEEERSKSSTLQRSCATWAPAPRPDRRDSRRFPTLAVTPRMPRVRLGTAVPAVPRV
jgi:hypothetical protein